MNHILNKSQTNLIDPEPRYGSITLAGMPEAAAECDVILSGFRAEINGLWKAASVRHDYSETYTTTIELEAPKGGRT